MNLTLVIYLADVIGKLGFLAALVGVAVLLATMLEVIITHLDRKPQDRRTKILAITCVALLAVSVFIPSQKTVYAMRCWLQAPLRKLHRHRKPEPFLTKH